ncbi:MAG: HAD family phosphatase [Chlamydiae bacterium]|nr:HAD family phosphatase [Chlamydiota bacterium]MBI3266697.1 HAD family phosphatase [Chlamydiota bacterium]
MGQLKAILFDIGNVILYFDNHRVSQRLAKLTGKNEPGLFKLIFDLYAEKELDLGKTSPQDYFKEISRKTGLELGEETLKNIFSDVFTENVKMANLIHFLKGRLPLIGISNTNESHFEFIQEHFPILNRLERIITSYEIGVKKPDPGIYFAALACVKARAQECLFIDDQQKNIIPAQFLGFQTHLYQSHEGFLQKLSMLHIL